MRLKVTHSILGTVMLGWQRYFYQKND